ncbi:leucine-rich PPR motif-containing protein, mitochondrial [Chanos chanos]|uniref:Leucine-rich PPR motif-containing protein, mitochondrial n=1 Tax=Chanos chanos TaxID=29144 RepID=A0A6J2V513_CHACN|nr:leucine-rich PPR motif-containing protein, mitochondrial [Chanos chanos]
MAALLRSARLLKFSSSTLLQVRGASKHSLPLNRLYSGAVDRRGIRIYPRQVVSGSLNVNRFVWPCSGVRQYGVATEQQSVPKDEASLGVRSKQAQQFDWALAKLDSSVRRTGRVTKTLVLRIFHDICRTGYPSGNQALLLLRSCGSLLPEVPLSERTELAHRIWDKLQELGASYDVSHYNALLKVYLQNEFKFSPTDFLAKMEAANVLPNRVTYQRLIAAYCQDGDIEGASKILGFMKSKDLPITEAVFNSLVTGHSRAGDMESAENILSVMRGAGIEPGADTYLSLLIAYAEKGDMEKIKQTLETVENTDTSLMDRDLMQVVFSLAKSGHQQYVPEVVERMRHERGYVPDAMNLCLSLITQGHEDTAFNVLKTFPTLQAESQNSETPDLGNFFLRHCVNMEKPVDKVVGYCQELKEGNLHSAPLQFTLYCALDGKKTGMAVALMKRMKEGGLPVRPHYFWPLLTQHQRDKNIPGTLEVLRGMQDLDVLPDVETYTTYILPAFPSVDSARTALKDAGCAVDTEGFVSSELRAEAASGDLSRLLSMMSSPEFPAIDLSAFRGSLIIGFRKFTDVETMAKITELLYNDKRFSQTAEPSETVAYFLYNLIDGMRETEVQAQEERLRQFFGQLKSRNIMIPMSIYRGIRNTLNSAHVPELIKDVIGLVDSKDPISLTEPTSPTPKGIEGKVIFLEKRLEELKAEGKPIGPTLKQLILALCAEEKLERALELKAQHEGEMTVGAYAALINLCSRHDNAEEALNLKRELSRKDSEVALEASKYIALVRVLCKHGRTEEAVDMLKEMKEKDVAMKDATATMLFHTLNSIALRKDAATIRRLQDTIFTLGLAKPTSNLCSPLVTSYLESEDLYGALDAAIECYKQYNQLPRIHDILCGLVEKGDTEALQKAMDFVSQERGEMTMLYDLFFAFMQKGRYREARKIIETPGLRARPGRLQWYAEKCIANQQMEVLENLVETTGKLFECDRDEMYHYVLRLCKDTNDWRKAEAMWTKMQEENVIPRERTLRLLADILKSNGQEVPFEVPEMWYEQVEQVKEVKAEPKEVRESRASQLPPPSKEEGADYQMRLLTLCKKGKLKEALSILKTAESKGVALGPAPYDSLIRAMLAAGSIEDAMAVRDMASALIPGFKLSDTANSLLIITQVKRDQIEDAVATFKNMLQADQVPSQLAISRLVQSLGSRGDVEAVQEVESLVKTVGPSVNLSSMLFLNNTALAHIKKGDIASAVDILESMYTEGAQNASMSYVFRKVLEDNNDDALDKLSGMAERLANHFASYRAATDLFLQYLDSGRTEEAKFLLQRCAAVSKQKEIFTSYMAKAAQQPGQSTKIKTLWELVPDFAEKDTFYSYLMKCYGMDNDLTSAKALYQQMLSEGVQVDELSLKRLALLYRNAGEAIPFEEPPESFRFYADKLREKSSKA